VNDSFLGSTVVVSSNLCPTHQLYHSHVPSTYYYSSTSVFAPTTTLLNPIVSTYRTVENNQCYQVSVDSYGNKTMRQLDYRACY
jgi:hypothetical protein